MHPIDLNSFVGASYHEPMEVENMKVKPKIERLPRLFCGVTPQTCLP